MIDRQYSYCACEILIANPIDWLFAACLEYFFFSIDSSEARKQYDEYCLSIMQTITYFERISGNIPGTYVTSHFHKLNKVSPFAPKLNF
jgi:hypothetical protein